MTLPGLELYAKSTSPVRVVSGWLEFEKRLPLFRALESGPWHHLILRYGRAAKRKNIVFYDGDREAAYNYTKKATDKDRPIPYVDGPAELREVRSRLHKEYGLSFSLCYVNYYADESVGIGWHNDAEEIGSQIPVRMLCLGGTRTLSIWKVRRGKDEKLQEPFAEWRELTNSGDLIEMPIGFHEEDAFRHAVLPQKQFAAPRISLTFRSPDLSTAGPWAPELLPHEKSEDLLETAEANKSRPQEGPKVWDCHAGKQYPEDAIYVGCRVRNRKGDVIRQGTIFGNGTDPLVSHNGWLKTEEEFRRYAERKMLDPAFRQQAEQLRGKHLLCWCVQDGPKRAKFCHARVWLDLINRPIGYEQRSAEEQAALKPNNPDAPCSPQAAENVSMPQEVGLTRNLSVALRPSSLEDLVGADEIKNSILEMLRQGRLPSALLFSGTPGSGKTTIARIFARMIQKTPQDWYDISEVNGADCNGTDDAREFISRARFMPMVGDYKVIIIDEAQRMTAAAQQIMLMDVEEPCPSTVWMFCTSEPSKIDPALRRRCVEYAMRTLTPGEVGILVRQCLKKIGGEIEKRFLQTDRHRELTEVLIANQVFTPGHIVMALDKFVSGVPATDAACPGRGASDDTRQLDSSAQTATLRSTQEG